LAVETKVERYRGKELKIMGYFSDAGYLVEHSDLFGQGGHEFYEHVGHGQTDYKIKHLGAFAEYKHLLVFSPLVGGREGCLDGPLLSGRDGRYYIAVKKKHP
jgi:hypothetical protein